MEQSYQEMLNSISDKTYTGLLDSLEQNISIQNGEFIEINKKNMIQLNLDERDYDFFWGCMKLYDAYGFNYFELYLDLCLHRFGNFSNGDEQWIRSYDNCYPYLRCEGHPGCFELCDCLSTLIKALLFFGLNCYDGKSVLELKDMLQEAPSISRSTYRDLLNARMEKGIQTRKTKTENYFNFDHFVENEFATNVERCTIRCKRGSDLSIDDALRIAQNAPKQMNVVIFRRVGIVCHVGKTDKLFTYIGAWYKKIEADSVSFEEIDAEYVDDVLLATIIFYDLPLDNVRVSKSNRKYGTVKQACNAYQRLESWSRKQILHAIQNGNLRVVALNNDQELIDKLALDKELRAR